MMNFVLTAKNYLLHHLHNIYEKIINNDKLTILFIIAIYFACGIFLISLCKFLTNQSWSLDDLRIMFFGKQYNHDNYENYENYDENRYAYSPFDNQYYYVQRGRYWF